MKQPKRIVALPLYLLIILGIPAVAYWYIGVIREGQIPPPPLSYDRNVDDFLRINAQKTAEQKFPGVFLTGEPDRQFVRQSRPGVTSEKWMTENVNVKYRYIWNGTYQGEGHRFLVEASLNDYTLRDVIFSASLLGTAK